MPTLDIIDICDYGKVYDLLDKEIARHEEGIAVVGSSNLTLAGLTHNTELNVIVQGNVNILEKAFRGALTCAVKRELNQLRWNAVVGDALYKNLIRIYDQHNLKDVAAR